VSQDAAGNSATSATFTVTTLPTSLLGDQAIEQSRDSNPAGTAQAFPFTASSTGSINRLFWYLDVTTAASTIAVGLYNDVGGHPNTLQTAGLITNPANGTWNAVNVPSVNLTAGTQYWLAILTPFGSGTVQFRDVAGSGSSETSSLTNLAALPTLWVTGQTWTTGSASAFAANVDSALLEPLTHFCRMCCIVFVYMFSGMRDSEVQSLKRGCVEPFWGHLTLTGKEFKTFRGAQARWVVIEPVAHAARLAEALSWHDDRIVVSARHGTDPVIDAGQEIDSLIKTMNIAADLGLLENIPDGAPIRPHRFRRTFAITARKYPWMQIALNWQFKHASHFMTQSYYALNDDVTADDNEVGKELVEAAVDRLADLYARHERGEPLYGKAAPRVVSEFGAIAADVAAVETVGQAGRFDGQIWRHAEARKRLRGSALRLYPGLALDCAFGPGGACGGVEAPNWNACNPRCGNAIIDATQLAFLKDTADRIRSYLDDGRIGSTQRLVLQDQLDELTTAIADHESRPTLGHDGAQR